MTFTAALVCLAAAAALTVGPVLANAVGERIARREWHAADADYYAHQLACEHDAHRQAGEQATAPLRIVEANET